MLVSRPFILAAKARRRSFLILALVAVLTLLAGAGREMCIRDRTFHVGQIIPYLRYKFCRLGVTSKY